jgi:hypothetical protein
MTISRSLWQKVRVLMSDAPGAAQTVSGITRADPGVATYVGADPANGSYAIFTAAGMREMNNRIARFANVNAGGNTGELEAIKTTNYGAFVSGQFQPLTFTYEFESLMNPNASGGEAEEIPADTIHDDIAVVEYGLFSALVYTFDAQWDPALAAHAALFEASQLKQPRGFQIIFANGRMALFYGTPAFSGVPAGNRIVSSQLKINSRGFPSYYAS